MQLNLQSTGDVRPLIYAYLSDVRAVMTSDTLDLSISLAGFATRHHKGISHQPPFAGTADALHSPQRHVTVSPTVCPRSALAPWVPASLHEHPPHALMSAVVSHPEQHKQRLAQPAPLISRETVQRLEVPALSLLQVLP